MPLSRRSRRLDEPQPAARPQAERHRLSARRTHMACAKLAMQQRLQAVRHLQLRTTDRASRPLPADNAGLEGGP